MASNKGFSNWQVNSLGCLTHLEADGKPILFAQGIEFSDGTLHFKHLDAPKSSARMRVVDYSFNGNVLQATLEVHLTKTRCTVSIRQTFSPTTVKREVGITVHEGGYFEDFALHNAFFKRNILHAHIAGHTITFRGDDRNHQYPTATAALASTNHTLEFHYTSNHPKGFNLTTYVRSTHDNQWWVHGRLFPINAQDTILRFCHPIWDKEVPFTRWLMKLRPIREYFWHVGERPDTAGRRTFGLAALSRTYVSPNTHINMTETIRYVSGGNP